MMSPEFFSKLCMKGGKEKEEKTLKSYFLALGVAVETNNGHIFIPSLVSDDSKVNINNFKQSLYLFCSRYTMKLTQNLKSL